MMASNWQAKKPRLVAASTEASRNVVEDLWGEDLSLDAVEECVFQASQFYPELRRTEHVASQAMPGPSQYFASFQPEHNSTAIPTTTQKPDDPISKAACEKLEYEVKRLKDELQGKAGEISFLRNQKKLDEDNWNNQLLAKTKQHVERIRTLEKESSLAKTSLELIKVDLWRAAEKKAPQAVPAEQRMVFHVDDAQGELLEDVLTPYLYERSELEIYNTKTASIPVKACIEAVWPPVQRLCLETSFAADRAAPGVRAVFTACHVVMAGLAEILTVRGRGETLEDLQRRDHELVERCELTLDDAQPLSAHGAPGELGVDARRALAVLAALCELAPYACRLVLGAMEPPREERVQTEECGPVTAETSSPSVYATCNSKLASQPIDCLDANSAQDCAPMGFLTLLRDVAAEIFKQRHGLAYGSVLAGIATLITAASAHVTLTGDSLALACETVRWTALCRPHAHALPAVLVLLATLPWPAGALCRGAHGRPCVEGPSGTIVFRAETCLVQLVCWLVEQRDSSASNRTRVCLKLIDWVWSAVKLRPRGPAWAQAKPANDAPDGCDCRPRLAEVCVRTIHRAMQDFEVHVSTRLGESLRKALVRGMMLLHHLTETDPDFGRHMHRAEGCYQLLLIGLRSTPHDLRLDKHEDKALRELLDMEDATEGGSFEETNVTRAHIEELRCSLLRCWANQPGTVAASSSC